MKVGVALSNKVKLRVALTLARTVILKKIGRTKNDTQTWSNYFTGFSHVEWSTVGVTTTLVKQLLVHGAYEFNESIHNIPAEEVVGSIAGLQHDPSLTAWEEVFYIAFARRVTDVVFAEEVNCAMQQEQMLGREH